VVIAAVNGCAIRKQKQIRNWNPPLAQTTRKDEAPIGQEIGQEHKTT
jgi:hypothetical protein